MKTYNLEDIFKFAINMEGQGKVFYDAVSDNTEDKKAKELFSYLGKQETEHAKTFGRLYNIYAKKGSSFSADEHFEEVLDTLFRGLLVPDISEVRDALVRKKRITSIIKIGMDVELNTILFYKKLKESIGAGEAGKALEKIIAEEENHLVRLKNLRIDVDPFYAGIEYAKFF